MKENVHFSSDKKLEGEGWASGGGVRLHGLGLNQIFNILL